MRTYIHVEYILQFYINYTISVVYKVLTVEIRPVHYLLGVCVCELVITFAYMNTT